jgi:thiol-disulfide isomerase/thioredoxin
MKNTFLCLCLVCFSIAHAQIKLSRQVGEKSPDIAITNWVENAPADKNLNNKFVVLEFWATWCGPCLAAVPHVNELRSAFKDNPNLLFLSMTDENVEKIQKTLKRVRFESAVVTDTNKLTHKNFSSDGSGAVELPFAVMIDNNQIIQWVGLPKHLTKEMLSNFIAGQPLVAKPEVTETSNSVSDMTKFVNQIKAEQGKNNIFNFQETNGSISMNIAMFDKGKYKNTNTTLSALLATLLDMPEYTIKTPASFKGKKYQITYKDTLQTDAKKVKSLILDSILTQLKLTHTPKMSDEWIYGLQIVDTVKMDIVKEVDFSKKDVDITLLISSESDTDDGVVFRNQSLAHISKSLSKRMNAVVENKSDFKRSVDLIVKTTSIEELEKSLNGYGIMLSKYTKNMQVQVFDSK